MQNMYLYTLVEFMSGSKSMTDHLCQTFESHAAITMLFCLDETAVMDVKNNKLLFV